MNSSFVVTLLAFLIPNSQAVCNPANQTGKFLGDTSRFQEIPKSDLYRCISDCLRSGICKAFDFGLVNRICSLYMESTDVLSVESNPDFTYGDIDQWSKTSGLCTGHTCSKFQHCCNGRNGQSRCEVLEICTLLSGRPTKYCLDLVNHDVHGVAEARRVCSQRGKQLAILDSVKRNNLYKTYLKIHGDSAEISAYIDGTDEEEEGAWIWGNGKLFGFNDWQIDKPNNYGDKEHCLVAAGKGWNDVGCNDSYGYTLCEITY
ncbi:uncharacterized protein [Haliotis asinina]|uniref:uncharacterized protein n=1 Tax=Haliotis asinina TaxID=109174 RepID=UPI0035317FBC